MDKIVLSNMRFRSRSGVLPKEKKDGQDFVVTVTMEIPDIRGCRTDDIADTVDYGEVFALVRDYIEGVSCNLIEYMAENVIIRIMKAYPVVEKVTCEIRKPLAPIDGCFDSMNVVIARTREQIGYAL
ncbi:MAG: dihydroneopterin aldolase [Clostridiales bacterium]|nr:dihydroneopterin aldolase [Clostridiales bacterium]MBR5974158.1 dihydroneopterin aldolase [Clostridiales bacterium]